MPLKKKKKKKKKTPKDKLENLPMLFIFKWRCIYNSSKEIQCSNLGMWKWYNLPINSKIVYERGTFIVQTSI